jgi:hypothetical protein
MYDLSLEGTKYWRIDKHAEPATDAVADATDGTAASQ